MTATSDLAADELSAAPTPDAGGEAAAPKKNSRQVVTRWGGHDVLARDGFVPIVNTFLKYGAQLKPYGLTPAEALFVIHLVAHKWDDEHPFPGYKSIAARMGVSVVYARQLARRLQTKGFLRRTPRVGNTNKFDLRPLFNALAQHVATEPPRPHRAADSRAA